MKVIGIYNAEGTLRGELLYLFNKLRGQGRCTLCEITHGWQPLGKKIWRSSLAKTALKIEMLHSDELSHEQRLATDQLPAFLVEQPEGQWRVLMSTAQIGQFIDDPAGLLREVETLVEKNKNKFE